MANRKQYVIFDGRSCSMAEPPDWANCIYCGDSLIEAKDIAPEFGDCICYSYNEKGVSQDDVELINERWEFSILNGELVEADNGTHS